jgi:hypothetical protein
VPIADAAPARSVPPPVQAPLSGAHDVDGAAFRVGSWTEASTGTCHSLVPSSMGCTSTQMAKSPSYPWQSSALPQEAGSPLAKGALSQGPSTPAAFVPPVAQVPCSAI